MSTDELYVEKEHLVFAAIKQRFGSIHKAKLIAEMNNMELDDLIQVGRMRLWELCLKYNPEKKDTFNQYVVIGVQGRMLNELHQKGKTISFPKNVSREIRDEVNFHSIDLHQDGEIANEFFAISPINVEEDVLNTLEFEEILSVLNKNEKFILTRKVFGYTDEEIGENLGLSTSTICRIKNKAVIKMNPERKKLGFITKKIKKHQRQLVV